MEAGYSPNSGPRAMPQAWSGGGCVQAAPNTSSRAQPSTQEERIKQASTSKDVGQDEELVLVVQNTFLEARVRPQVLRRSCSDSELSSSSFKSFSSSMTSSESGQDRGEGSGSGPLAEVRARESAESLHTDKRFVRAAASSSSEAQRAVGDSPLVDPPFLSIGSAEHDQGTCQPCCFFMRGVCKLAAECTHCHAEHVKRCRPGQRGRAREKARKAREGPDQETRGRIE